MDTREADEVFRQLVEIAESLGFGWLTESVRDEIIAGRPTPEIEKPTGSSQGLELDRRRALRVRELEPELARELGSSRVRSVAYSSQDRLHLLLTALEHAIADAFKLEQALLQFAQEHHVSSVLFADEAATVESGRQVTVDAAHVSNTAPAVAALVAALQQLRSEIAR
jgi:hypothetical protein